MNELGSGCDFCGNKVYKNGLCYPCWRAEQEAYENPDDRGDDQFLERETNGSKETA